MKTVPKLRVVAHDDASQIDLPDLLEEVRLALELNVTEEFALSALTVRLARLVGSAG